MSSPKPKNNTHRTNSRYFVSVNLFPVFLAQLLLFVPLVLIKQGPQRGSGMWLLFIGVGSLGLAAVYAARKGDLGAYSAVKKNRGADHET